METPSSMKRVTRSQTMLGRNAIATNTTNIPISRKVEDSEKNASKSRRRNTKQQQQQQQQQQQERSALGDITNDSPIVGVAMGRLKTPSSDITKQKSSEGKNKSNTPGSGEALLRCQVKTLLQRVEEEAELSKLNPPFLHPQRFVDSPIGLLAANTPQFPDLSGDEADINGIGLASVTPLPVVEDQLKICQVEEGHDQVDGKKQEGLESQKSLTRSLMLDFSEKTESSDTSSEECSSVLTYQGLEEVIVRESKNTNKSPAKHDDEVASIWSNQINASIHDDEEEEDYYDYYYEDGEKENDDGLLVDGLCEGIRKMGVKEKEMPKFRGKHTRFMYSEDEELVGQVVEECAEESEDSSAAASQSSVLPTPKGKHLRFPKED